MDRHGPHTVIPLPGLSATGTATDALEDRIRFRSGVAHLAGTLFRPRGGAPRAVAVLNGATGVPQGFYAAFARWLAAAKGVACLTYDYRDFGLSARAKPRASRATMADWGLHDQFAARQEVATRLPGLPVWVIGHSLGGLMLPFQPAPEMVERIITVASGPVHFSDHPLHYKPVAAAFWHLYGPPLVAALGYLPGRSMGLGADLPAGVYWQWRRWCTTRGFFAGDFGRSLPMPDGASIRARARFVAVSDDVMVPPDAVWRLMPLYAGAEKQQVVLKPETFNLPAIGHIGAFRAANAVLWDRIVSED